MAPPASMAAQDGAEMPQTITLGLFLQYTYARRGNDRLLSDVSLTTTIPLDNHRSFDKPQHDLGDLEMLPLELQQLVLASVDLQTLTDFRRVNRKAREVVNSVQDYGRIVNHAAPALRAALSIEAARHFTCADLLHTLTSSECVECGAFTSFIYLPTCKRVCYLCRCECTQYFPLGTNEAARNYGVDRATIKKLPYVKSLPGFYGPKCRRQRTRLHLVDRQAARQAGVEHHGSEIDMYNYAFDKHTREVKKYQKKKAKNAAAGDNKHVRRPPHLVPTDDREDDPRRYMLVIHARPFDKASMDVKEGRHCLACAKEVIGWAKEFDKKKFEQHMQEYGAIERMGNGGFRHRKAGMQ